MLALHLRQRALASADALARGVHTEFMQRAISARGLF